jgi:dipeptidyl aminopeptidase/acylaminoacyl peptidase
MTPEITITSDKPNRDYFCWVLVTFVLMLCQGVCVADGHRFNVKDIPNLIGASELVMGSEVAISPDGNWVAYTVSTTEVLTGKSRQRLWVKPFENGAAIQIGDHEADNFGPAWSPNSAKLLFSSTSGGHASVAIWNVATKKTSSVNIATRQPAQWLPDSTRFLTGIAHTSTEQGAQALDPKTPAPTVFTAADTSRPLPQGHFISPSRLASNADSFDFALVDIDTGAMKTVATNVDPNYLHYQLSPDGTKIFYTDLKGSFDYDINNRLLYDIKVVDLRDGSSLVVAKGILGAGQVSPAWSQSGKMLAVIGGTLDDDDSKVPVGTSRALDRPGHCYVIDLERPGRVRPVGPRLFSRWLSPIWGNDDSSIYVVPSRKENDVSPKIMMLTVASGAIQNAASLPASTLSIDTVVQQPSQQNVYVIAMNKGGEQEQVFTFNLRSHELRPILQVNQYVWSLSVSNAGTHIAYRAEDSSHPPNVWVTDGGTEPHQLIHSDLGLDPQKLGDTKTISWETNGNTHYGTVRLPVNYDARQRYPTIVEVYPEAYSGSFVRNLFVRGIPFYDSVIWQALAASGYAVFIPDLDTRVGTPMQDIAANVRPALDKIVAMGIADPDRLGLYGRSAGGYSTFSLVVQSDRFRAAVSSVGYANLFTLYDNLEENGNTTALGLLENEELGVTPWQDRNLYIENSPYFFFDRVTTPVLIQYGGKDSLTADSCKEAFVALRRLGKTATLVGYADEGHGVEKPENRVDFTNRLLEWFDQYLKPERKTLAAH